VNSDYIRQFDLLSNDDPARLIGILQESKDGNTHTCRHCGLAMKLKFQPKRSGNAGGSYQTIQARRHLERKCNAMGKASIAHLTEVYQRKHAIKKERIARESLGIPVGDGHGNGNGTMMPGAGLGMGMGMGPYASAPGPGPYSAMMNQNHGLTMGSPEMYNHLQSLSSSRKKPRLSTSSTPGTTSRTILNTSSTPGTLSYASNALDEILAQTSSLTLLDFMEDEFTSHLLTNTSLQYSYLHDHEHGGGSAHGQGQGHGHGLGWSKAKVDYVTFLVATLVARIGGARTSPPPHVEALWRIHLLETENYQHVEKLVIETVYKHRSRECQELGFGCGYGNEGQGGVTRIHHSALNTAGRMERLIATRSLYSSLGFEWPADTNNVSVASPAAGHGHGPGGSNAHTSRLSGASSIGNTATKNNNGNKSRTSIGDESATGGNADGGGDDNNTESDDDQQQAQQKKSCHVK